ncbi:MAG: 50S ribosomal protein L32 [Bacilli bacterium]|nr:50S ribosomal protein L32 [Bacilli bacterium]
MAVPKRRTGVERKRVRRQHLALKATNVIACPNCGAMIRPHHVCPNCGYYNGKKVIDVKEKA